MAAKETDQFNTRPTTFIETEGTSLKAALDVSRKFGAVRDSVLPFASGRCTRATRDVLRARGAAEDQHVLQPRSRARRTGAAGLRPRGRSSRGWTSTPPGTRATDDKGKMDVYRRKTARGGHALPSSDTRRTASSSGTAGAPAGATRASPTRRSPTRRTHSPRRTASSCSVETRGETVKRMTGRLAVALLAALVVVPTAMANDDHGSKKKHDELEISVVSSPAKYVSGGDARIEIAVPAKTDLDDVDVTLNGADVTSAFGPDPEGNHQLEGVVTGLPLGESRIVASSHKPGKARSTVTSSSSSTTRSRDRSSPARTRCRSCARRRTTPPGWGCRRSRSRRPARRRRSCRTSTSRRPARPGCRTTPQRRRRRRRSGRRRRWTA